MREQKRRVPETTQLKQIIIFKAASAFTRQRLQLSGRWLLQQGTGAIRATSTPPRHGRNRFAAVRLYMYIPQRLCSLTFTEAEDTMETTVP